MINYNDIRLLNAREVYRDKVLSDVRYFRIIENRNSRDDFDYPAVIVAGADKRFRIECGRSMRSHLAHYHIRERELNPSLCQLLRMRYISSVGAYAPSLPTIHKVNGTKLYFGSCAEDDVVSKLFPKDVIDFKNDIYLSTPVRPRTNERIDYCPVCKSIFS